MNTEKPEPRVTGPAGTAVPSRDEGAQLEKLKNLLERGLISQEEYNNKRKEILDRL